MSIGVCCGPMRHLLKWRQWDLPFALAARFVSEKTFLHLQGPSRILPGPSHYQGLPFWNRSSTSKHHVTTVESVASSGSRGGLGARPPSLPPRFFKIMQFSGNFLGKKPYFEQILGSGPPLGVKSLLGPPDQNPGSVPGYGHLCPSVHTAGPPTRPTVLHIYFFSVICVDTVLQSFMFN